MLYKVVVVHSSSLEQRFFSRMELRHDYYVQLLALPVYRHNAHDMAKDWPVDIDHSMRMTAVNIGLKTSNDLYTCFRTKTNQMGTRGLQFCKELGTCVGCLFMLIPQYAVSSRY